jgi:O-acetyl-ADP-ribose deacetylase (regulator of RNase III)
LKIFFVDMDPVKCWLLEREFQDYTNVSVHHADIKRFFSENRNEVDCLVSPANAYGLMTGGYDAALSDILGWDFQEKVQKYIKDHFYGEQGVGTSFYIETDIPGISLIHTPTMQYPSRIIDDMIVYYCMRSTLMCALSNGVRSIVIPVFGGQCGGVDPDVAVRRMREAYEQILNHVGPDY